jgi:glyoxylase-like metal-dependent hydrolase (beta-lactamase superfamily II)
VIVDLGAGGLAVALLGACSSGSAGAPSRTSATGPSTGPTETGTGGTPSGTAGAEPAGDLAWSRVDLGFVSAYVLVRGREAAVVDTGVAGSAGEIQRVLGEAGSGWDAVRHVVLTHHHPDHAGSVGEVMTAAARATVYAGEADIASISTPRPLSAAADGSEIFGLQIVATPGHTAGHISVFDPDSAVLIAGDALNNNGALTGANPRFTQDMAQAQASIGVLAALPVRTILFGHGEPLTEGAGPALRELARG